MGRTSLRRIAGLPHAAGTASGGECKAIVNSSIVGVFFNDYAAIRRNFLPADYSAVAARHNVVATVTMEAEWDEGRLADETRWTETLHRTNPRFPAAHVARTVLHAPGAADEIAAHAQFPFVRGLRHKPTTASAPDRIDRSAAGSMRDPAWRRGYAALARHGLHFELQAPWWHVDELIDLVAAHPETPVVIVHAFMPSDRSPEALAGWRAALKRSASLPNVAIKISGIGLKGIGWPDVAQRPLIRDMLEIFGVDRCLFASNFPVDGLTGSFDTLYAGYKAATADLSRRDRLKLFHDNAVHLYRLDIPPANS